MERCRLLSKALATIAAGALAAWSAAVPLAATDSPAPPRVNPVSSTPTATPGHAIVSQQTIQIAGLPLPAPGALHYTTDIGTCKRAGGNDGTCGALLNGSVAFNFTWSCAPNCVITGFKFKSASLTAGDPHAVVHLGGTDPMADAIDVGTGTLFIEKPPAGGWGGRCYAVTAYKKPQPKLVSDGMGGLHPEGPPVGTFEESPASPKVCVAALTREVELPVLKKRSYTRTYSFTANTDPKTTDDPPRETAWIYIGKKAFGQSGFSVANTFHRAGASFDGAPLGDVTIYSGRFAFDAVKSCAPRFFSPAPSNWESAAWTKAAGSPLPGSWGGSGQTHAMDVSSVVHGWKPPKKLTFFLMESLTEGLDAEQFKTDVGMLDGCEADGEKLRLILEVGLTK